MNYVLFGGLAVFGLWLANRYYFRGDLSRVMQSMQYIVGGLAGLIAVFFLLRGRIDVAAITGAIAFTILRTGRIGPIDFKRTSPSDDNESTVRSRYIAMNLDHATGQVSGKVIYGEFQGIDLIDLTEDESRRLLALVANDPDSLSLLETWLDKNRSGWREYFAEQDAARAAGGGGGDATMSTSDLDRQAYEVLGLEPGATADEIRAAHRKLMKGVHPDQGGSNYLASRINEAKERLLKKVQG